MGCIAAHLLQSGGMEVVLYERREGRVDDLAGGGIRLRGDLDVEEAVEVRKPGEPTRPFDFFVLAVPAGAEGEALRPLSPYVHRETVYLSAQEGSAVEELARLVGEERAGGAVSFVSAVESESGEVEVEEFRRLAVGSFLPGRESAFEPLVRAAQAALPGKVELTSDLEGEIWRRLESAAAVSGLCAALGAAPAEIAEREEARVLCREAAEEAAREAGGGPATPEGSPWEEAVWRAVKPPLLRDLEAGRKSEIDCLSGRVVRQARSRGRAAPVHSAMLSLVREMESGRQKPGEAGFRELMRRVREEKGMSLF